MKPRNPLAEEEQNCEPDWQRDVGRSLPHSDDAERSVLGCLLIQPSCLSDCIEQFGCVAGETGASVFYNENHGLIYKVLCDMAEKKTPIDMMTVTESLKNLNQLERVGGAAAIAQLTNAVPTAANVGYWIEAVVKKYQLRKLIEVGTQLVTESFECPDSHVEVLQADYFQTFASLNNAGKQTGAAIGDVLDSVGDEIEKMVMSSTHLLGLSTGFKELDMPTRGLRPGKMWIIAGRPSTGKSTLVRNIVQNVSAQESAVLVCTIEETKEDWVTALVSAEAGVDLDDACFQDKVQKAETLARVASAMQRIRSKYRIFIEDKGDMTTSWIAARARQAKAKHDIGLLVVDYLQICHHHKRFDNRVQEVTAISSDLKNLAKDLRIPVIALSQFNREVEKRDGGRPMLADLRESGALEQDADVAVLIFPNPLDKDLPESKRGLLSAEEMQDIVQLIIAKNRSGPKAKAHARFNKAMKRYEPIIWPNPQVQKDIGKTPYKD